jgi:hypothetical protein
VLETTDLSVTDQGLALRIIAVALSIAPGLDDLPTGRNRQMAVAILNGVAAEAGLRGSRFVKAQRMGPASVDYSSVDSWFSADDRIALRSLGGIGASRLPVGYFPKPGLLGRLWPEEQESQL